MYYSDYEMFDFIAYILIVAVCAKSKQKTKKMKKKNQLATLQTSTMYDGKNMIYEQK